MSKSSDISLITKRYADSLFACLSSKKETDELIKNMNEFAQMLHDSADLQKMVASPIFTSAQKKAAVEALAKKAKMGKIFSNFLMLLAKNGRLPLVLSVFDAFNGLLAKANGVFEADLTTAHELTAKEIEAVQKSLTKQLGKDVSVRPFMDERLLGGMKLRVGSVMVDDSVRTKLERLHRNLNNTQNLNSTLTHNLKEVG